MKRLVQTVVACAVIVQTAACGSGSNNALLPASSTLSRAGAASSAPLTVTPGSLSFTAVGATNAQTFTATVHGPGTLTASSTDAQVASVNPTSAQGAAQPGGDKTLVFTVTPSGAGTCTITVTDKKGNTATVSVSITLPVLTSLTVLNQYAIPSGETSNGIVAGPNGSVWFTEWMNDSVGRLSSTGTQANSTLDAAPFSSSKPYGIALGPDGNFWVADYSNDRIVQMNSSGTILNSFSTPYAPTHITSGPDGNLWFTEEDSSGATGFSEVVKLTTSGAMTAFPTSAAAQAARNFAFDIVPGPDGRLWFTEGSLIGAITTAGVLSEYTVIGGQAEYIVAGHDGNLWYTEPSGNRIGRMSTGGVSSTFSVPTMFATPWQIDAGKDGAVWFTETAGGQVGRAAADGTITEYPVSNLSGNSAILAAPDGNLWVTSYTGKMFVFSY
jgi:streptogramin lyase